MVPPVLFQDLAGPGKILGAGATFILWNICPVIASDAPARSGSIFMLHHSWPIICKCREDFFKVDLLLVLRVPAMPCLGFDGSG